MINTNSEITIDDLLTRIEKYIKINSILSEYNLFWITLTENQETIHFSLTFINFLNDIGSQPSNIIEHKLESNGLLYEDFIAFLDDFAIPCYPYTKSVLQNDFFIKTTSDFASIIKKAVKYIKNISNCLSNSHYNVIKTSIRNNSKYFLFSSD